jgi:hypothetical protein
MSARKSLNNNSIDVNVVPAIQVKVDRRTEPASINKMNATEKSSFLNLSSRNDNNKHRKSSLLAVNLDNLSTNFSSRMSSRRSSHLGSRRSSRRSSKRSSISSAAGKGPTISVFKVIGKPPQPKKVDPAEVAQREHEAQQKDYRSNVLADCDRTNLRTSVSMSRAIKTD